MSDITAGDFGIGTQARVRVRATWDQNLIVLPLQGIFRLWDGAAEVFNKNIVFSGAATFQEEASLWETGKSWTEAQINGFEFSVDSYSDSTWTFGLGVLVLYEVYLDLQYDIAFEDIVTISSPIQMTPALASAIADAPSVNSSTSKTVTAGSSTSKSVTINSTTSKTVTVDSKRN